MQAGREREEEEKRVKGEGERAVAEMRREKGGWDSATGRRGEMDDGEGTEEPCECGHETCKHGGIQLHYMHLTLGKEASLASLPPFLLPTPALSWYCCMCCSLTPSPA